MWSECMAETESCVFHSSVLHDHTILFQWNKLAEAKLRWNGREDCCSLLTLAESIYLYLLHLLLSATACSLPGPPALRWATQLNRAPAIGQNWSYLLFSADFTTELLPANLNHLIKQYLILSVLLLTPSSGILSQEQAEPQFKERYASLWVFLHRTTAALPGKLEDKTICFTLCGIRHRNTLQS